MEHVAQVRKLFTAVESKLHHEIRILEEARNKIDRYGEDPGERWVYPVYERLIERRRKLLSVLSS